MADDKKPLDLGEFGGAKPLDLTEFQSEPTQPAASSGALRRVADTGLALAKGVMVGVPETAVGLADLVTGGKAGKAVQAAGRDFKADREFLTSLQSPEQHAADAEVQAAKGFLPTVGAMVQNPSTIANALAESAPSMVVGGLAGRGLMAAKLARSPIAAGAAGEGVVTAGQNAEQVRQETADGLLTPEQSAVMAASGMATGAISAGAGRVAHRLKLADIDTMIAAGKLAPGSGKNVLRRMAGGALSEGVLEELPQSMQEQAAQNLALGRPIMEGVPEAGASGMLVGGLMGAGGNVLQGAPERTTTTPPPAPQPVAPPPAAVAPTTPTTPTTPVAPPVAGPNVAVSTTPPPQSETTGGFSGGFQAPPTPPAAPAPTPPQAPNSASAAMGLRRTAGPISSAAATAVDTGATLIEQHRQIKTEADDEASKAKTAGKTGAAAPSKPAEPVQQAAARPAAPVTGPITAALSSATQGAPANAQGTQAQQGQAAPAGGAPTDAGAAPGTGQPAASGTPSLPAAVPGAAAGAGQPSSASTLTPKEPSNAQGREIQSIDPDTGEITFTSPDAGRAQAPADAQGDGAGAPAQAQPAVPAGQPGEPAAAAPVQPAPQGPANSVDAAAHQAATSPRNDLPEPTDGQKKAGNYRLGHLNWRGLGISIENPKGSTRSGTDADGKPWSVTMPAHYGYVKRTKGADGDHVDVYIGDHPESERVFVVDQQDAKTKKWDEHKVILGTRSIFEARRLYDQGFSDGRGRDRRRAITAMTVEQFKTWLRDGDTAKPAAELIKGDAETKAPEPETVAPAAETAAPPEETAGSKTEAAPKKPAKSGKPDQTKGPRMAAWEKNPFMTLLGRHGLYHVKGDRKSLKTEFSPDKAIMVPGYPPVFRYNGLHVDQLLVYAIQDGFLLPGSDERDLSTLIERAIRGERIAPLYAEGGDQAEFERERAKRGLDDMDETDEALRDLTTEELEAIRQSGLDDDIVLWGESNVSTEQAMRALGFSEQEIQDEIAREQAAQSQDRQGGVGAGQAAQGPTEEGGQPGSAGAPDAGAPSEGLTAPTRADVLAQQSRAENAQSLDERAQIDREAAAQTLTAQTAPEQRRDTTGDIFGGPSPEEALAAKKREDEAKAKRKAEEDAASGQAGLFAQPAEPAQETQPAQPAGERKTLFSYLNGGKSFVLGTLTVDGESHKVKLNHKQTNRADWYFDLYTDKAVAESIAFPALSNSGRVVTPAEAAQLLVEYLQTDSESKISFDLDPALRDGQTAERFSAGKALTAEQRKKVLATLVDVYKAMSAPREQKGLDANGNERYGYVHSPDLFKKSDITGAMVRYYVTLPDGRIAHPTELFPDYKQSDIDAEMLRRQVEAQNNKATVKGYTVEAQQFDSPQEAMAYWDGKSDESLARHGQWRTIFGAKDRTLLTNGSKFVMVPKTSLDDGALVEAFADAGWQSTAYTESLDPRDRPDAGYTASEPEVTYGKPSPQAIRAAIKKSTTKYDAEQTSAIAKWIARRPDSARIVANLNQHAGTPWAKQSLEGVLTRVALEEYVAGRTPKFESFLSAPTAVGLRTLLEQNGADGVWMYLSREGMIGSSSKPVNSVSSSFIDCNPSTDCAKFCYATKGMFAFGASVRKSELMTWAAEKDPKRLGQLMASEYATTLEYQHQKALRLFDKGDGTDAWLPVIEELNAWRGVDGKGHPIRVQVFSKNPEFLRKVPAMNLRLLSVDQSNVAVARANPDLPVAFVYSSPEQIEFLNEVKDRVQVILPVKMGAKILEQGKIDELPKWTKPVVCPVDDGRVKIGPNRFQKTENGSSLVTNQGEWNCTRCDKGGGVGCFHKSTTDKALAAFTSQVHTRTDEEVDRLISELRAISGRLPPGERAELLGSLGRLVHAVRAGVDIGTEGTGRPGDAAATGADDQWQVVRFVGRRNSPEGGGQVESPRAQYNVSGAYQHDLFNNPVSPPLPGPASAGPNSQGVRGNVQPAAGVRDTPIPAGEYLVNTFVSTETQRELGAATVLTPEQAAQATQYLYRGAVERFDALVTDSKGTPLAVVGGFKGAVAKASIYPGTIVAEAVRVPGAARIWFSHNHPSGLSSLSEADELLQQTLYNTFRGSGIEPMGLLAIGNGKFSFTSSAGGGTLSGGDVKKTVVHKTVPVYEREIAPGGTTGPQIATPTDARMVARQFYAKARAPGILLLNSQNNVVGWVPISKGMMQPLRGGELNTIFRAISQSNTVRTMLVHGGELDARLSGARNQSVGQNIASALQMVDASPLDSINATTNQSAAEKGDRLFGVGVFARGGDPFYSALEREISGVNAKTQPVMGWLATINGLVKAGKVKADEVEWSGLLDWLKMQQGKVTREQVMGFLAANGVKVEEAVLSDAEVRRLPDGWRFIQNPDEEYGGVAVLDANGEVAGVGESEQEALADAGDEDAYSDAKGAPKYGKYTLPGGTNYREILLTLPPSPEQRRFNELGSMKLGTRTPAEDAEYRELGMRESLGTRFKSNHWDQPNVLAHIRVNDRTDADGARVLFVEEVQSDWGQTGKKEGFASKAVSAEKIGEVKTIPGNGLRDRYEQQWKITMQDGSVQERSLPAGVDPLLGAGGKDGPPIAPFVTATDKWLTLALKRVITMAAQEGYDKVAFVNGEQSAERYDLSKQISKISYEKADNGNYEIYAYDLNGAQVLHEGEDVEIPISRVEELVGKEIATKIANGEGAKWDGSPARDWRDLTGLDLKVGGTGMIQFYDKIVPNTLKDVLRKVGGGSVIDVGISYVPATKDYDWTRTEYQAMVAAGISQARWDSMTSAERQAVIAGQRGTPAAVQSKQPGFDITPAMRERAADGLPLFERTSDQLRRAGTGEQAMDTARVQRIVAPLVAKWDVDVRVVATPADLPVQAPSDARGMHWNGTIYVVARTNRTEADVRRTLAHEAIAHYGLRAMLGREGYRKFVNQLQFAARQRGGPLREISDYVRRIYVDEEGNFNLTPAQEGDEIAARAVELGVDPLTGEFKPGFSMLKAVFAKVMEFLRSLGLNITMSNAELQGNLVRSMRNLERGVRATVAREAAVAARRPPLYFDAKDSPLYEQRTAASVGVISKEQADRALQSDATSRRILGKGNVIKDGQPVGVRLNINVLKNTGVPVTSIHAGGKGEGYKQNRGWWGNEVLSYAPVVTLKDAYFNVSQRAREQIASGQAAKSPMASVDGNFVATDKHSFDGVEFRFNPKREHLFVDRLGRVLRSADEITVYGNHVYARGTIEYYGPEDVPARAGDAPTAGRLFEEGGADKPLFARAGTAQGLSDVTDTLRNLVDPIGKVSLWEKTVGTQFHKATKDKDFKRVFDAYLQQTDDTAHYAIEAERNAPDILMRLDSVVDAAKALWHSGPKHKRDLEAVSKALFANIEGKEGVQSVRFDDDTLRIAYNLTPKQIDMYHQARAAVDTSIDRLAQTYAAQVAQAQGMDINEVKNMALDDTVAIAKDYIQTTHDELRAQEALRKQLEEEGDLEWEMAQAEGKTKYPPAPSKQDTQDLLDSLDAIEEKAKFLKDAGYMPALRFGEYAVTVTNDDGETLHFEMFESKVAANLGAMRLRKEYPGASVEKSVLNPEQYAMFKGVSPETVELFAAFTGADKTEAYQQYIAMARSARSTKMRELKRKGIAGFSEDATRVLASFLTSNARQSAINMNQQEIAQAMGSKTLARKGDVQREAQKLHEYMSNPREEAQAIRGFMFFHMIGGSLASALVNLTQPIMQTSPYLAQFSGAKTPGFMASAAKMAATGKIADADLRSAAEQAAADGITEPHEIHQLMADAGGSAFGDSLMGRAAVKLWGSMFASAESFNRRITFLAAYQVAKDKGMPDPYGFARKAVYETQGLYNKVNRPNWGRGAVGATLFTFKQFSISYMEWLLRLPPKQQLLALGLLVLAAGADGLPFADDAEDVIDTIGQSLGYNTNSKKAMREMLVNNLGETAGTILNTGLLSMSGVDVSGRLGMGNLFPGTAMFKPSEKDKSRTLSEFAGPLGGLLQQAQQSVAKVQAGDLFGRTGAAAALLPKALRDFMQGSEMADTGVYRDARGYKVADVTAGEGYLKMLGLQPSSIASRMRKLSDVMQDRDLVTTIEAEIADRWASGLVEKDADKVAKARQTLIEWNRNNPETPIRINPMQIARRARQMNMDRQARILKTMPKELRAQAAKDLQ